MDPMTNKSNLTAPPAATKMTEPDKAPSPDKEKAAKATKTDEEKKGTEFAPRVKLKVLRPIRLKDGTVYDPATLPKGKDLIVEVPADEADDLTRSFPGGHSFRGERYDEPEPESFRRAERVA